MIKYTMVLNLMKYFVKDCQFTALSNKSNFGIGMQHWLCIPIE